MAELASEPMDKGREGWPERALDLNETDLSAFLFRYDLVVIDCWVGWCKHSKHMMPIFESLAKEMSGKAAFGKIDAQQFFHVPVMFRVNATPTFLIFKGGQLVDRIVGEVDRDEMEHAIRRQMEPMVSPST